MAYSIDQAFTRLKDAHQRGRLAHAYMFTGPAGADNEALACRMIALVHARAVPASLDAAVGDGVSVLRPASKSRRIKVDEIHELENTLRLTMGKYPLKIGIIVDADRLMVPAQNTFLKTLEEPPKNTLLLLLTSQPQQLLPTILSRCIEVRLTGALRRPPAPGTPEAQLLDLLSEHGTLARRGISPALLLARGFTEVLEAAREEITARHKAVFTEDIAVVKKATEGGEWIEEREESMKAMTEAEYLGERTRLIGTLISWFGDAIRIREGAANLDITERADKIRALAAATTTANLLKRQESMDRLRALFETNASEALAIEVCFLRAFG